MQCNAMQRNATQRNATLHYTTLHYTTQATFFHGDLVTKYFLRSFSPFRWYRLED